MWLSTFTLPRASNPKAPKHTARTRTARISLMPIDYPSGTGWQLARMNAAEMAAAAAWKSQELEERRRSAAVGACPRQETEREKIQLRLYVSRHPCPDKTKVTEWAQDALHAGALDATQEPLHAVPGAVLPVFSGCQGFPSSCVQKFRRVVKGSQGFSEALSRVRFEFLGCLEFSHESPGCQIFQVFQWYFWGSAEVRTMSPGPGSLQGGEALSSFPNFAAFPVFSDCPKAFSGVLTVSQVLTGRRFRTALPGSNFSSLPRTWQEFPQAPRFSGFPQFFPGFSKVLRARRTSFCRVPKFFWFLDFAIPGVSSSCQGLPEFCRGA